MKRIWFLLLLILAISVIEYPVVDKQSEKDFSYCLESDGSYPLPTIGDIRNISVNFSVLDGSMKELHGTTKCEYKASMCDNHFRRDLWHGDQEQKRQTLNLSSGHKLIFFPHGACLQLSDYLKNCPDENCNAMEQFEILVMHPQRNPDRSMVPYSELSTVIGNNVLNLDVTVATEMRPK